MATRIAEKEYPDFTPAITAIPSDFGTYVTADTPHDYFTQRPAPRTDDDTAVQVPVLTWHQLTEEVSGSATISPETFRKQIQALSDAGCNTISLEELRDYVYNGTPLPEKPIVLTFDDGYLSNYEDAFRCWGIQHEGDHFRHRRFHRQGYLQGHRPRHDTALRRG